MHRSPLLRALARYRRRYADEAAVIDRFIDFVEAHQQCFSRRLAVGHVTGSAWLVDESGGRVLLTHHRKLDRWLQLGGHSDGDPDTLAVAVREAEEESGLRGLVALSEEIFDLDIHIIPARPGEPEHRHYDVRYALQANGRDDPVVSDESHDLAWVAVADLHNLTDEPSMLRMADKWSRQQAVERSP